MKKLIEEYQKIINEDSLRQQINEFYKKCYSNQRKYSR